ncbi:hypothetical protein ACI3PL_26040, partial [Lacticaseibacillus paracasei]
MKGDTLNDAVAYVRSVALRFRGRGKLMMGGIQHALRQYQRPDDSTYWDLASAFMSHADIERTWDEVV